MSSKNVRGQRTKDSQRRVPQSSSFGGTTSTSTSGYSKKTDVNGDRYITRSRSDLYAVRSRMAKHILSNFHFRKVENVYTEKPPLQTVDVPCGPDKDGIMTFANVPVHAEYAPIVIMHSHEGVKELVDPEEIDQLDESAFENNIAVIPWSFTGITSHSDNVFRTKFRREYDRTHASLMEDPYHGHPIIFTSGTRHEFNPYLFSFEEIDKNFFPFGGDGVRMPHIGDVIAYIPSSDSLMEAFIDMCESDTVASTSSEENECHAPKPLQAEAWFVCSYQLLRTMAMIAFGPSHPLLRRDTKGKYSVARKWLFQGNHLRTNKLLERIHAYNDSEVEFDPKLPTISCLYTCSRMEMTYLNWVHIYPAIVLLIVYGILPTDSNAPKTLDQEGQPSKINMKHWHIPDDYVTDFIDRWMQ